MKPETIDYNTALKRILEENTPFNNDIPVNILIPLELAKKLAKAGQIKDQELQKMYRAIDRQSNTIRTLIQEMGKLAKTVNILAEHPEMLTRMVENPAYQKPQECEPTDFRPWEISRISDPE